MADDALEQQKSALLSPSPVPFPQARDEDPRFGHVLGEHLDAPEEADVVLVGFPSDEGVRRNDGRPGASDGPAAIREVLYGLTPDPRHFGDFVALVEGAVDLGDVKVSGEVEADQAALGRVLAPHLERGATCVVLGGGHETAFAHFSGYVEAKKPVGILNWDAHPDVRPLVGGRPHSGSPFRQALASDFCLRYHVLGLNPASVSHAHIRYIEEEGGAYDWKEEIRREAIPSVYSAVNELHLVTFDLDAVDQSQAPGVSAPNADGLSTATWLRAAYEAGRCPQVASIDISELNPRFDVDGRTARLAALTVWQFLSGLAARKSASAQ